jgi:RNA polymerase sigma factor for flagellar operon FliA
MAAVAVAPNQTRRDALLFTHRKMVYGIASCVYKDVAGSCTAVCLDDLVSEGMIGLIDAVGKWDDTRGVPFNAYAKHRVRGAILDSLRRGDYLTRTHRADIRNGKVEPLANLELDRAAADGVFPDLPCGAETWPEQLAAEKEMASLIDDALAGLPERWRTVIVLYFRENLLLHEIGDRLGVNESRVSQIRTAALRRLREIMAAHGRTTLRAFPI